MRFRAILAVAATLLAVSCASTETVVAGGPPPELIAPTPTAVITDPTPPPTEPTPNQVIGESTPAPTVGDQDQAYFFATARPRGDGDQIAVFDEPDGPPRTLADVNVIDGVTQSNPLYATTQYGNPLVLRVIESTGEWLRVQVPTRPNQADVWVRSVDFEIGVTDIWIEISVAPIAQSAGGQLWVYQAGEQVLQARIVSGRPERPTALVTGWVDEATPGSFIGRAYGSWVVGIGTYSEALGSFAGGMPGSAIHGTNQPELMGQRVSSGNIRLPNETLDALVALDGFIGAPVHIHDGPQIGPDPAAEFGLTSPATTTLWDIDAEPLPQVP